MVSYFFFLVPRHDGPVDISKQHSIGSQSGYSTARVKRRVPGKTHDDVMKVASRIRDRKPETKVWVCAVPDGASRVKHREISRLNSMLKNTCRAQGMTFIDLPDIYPSRFTRGRLHLNRQGKLFVTKVIYRNVVSVVE